jgi:hypothetical protein
MRIEYEIYLTLDLGWKNSNPGYGMFIPYPLRNTDPNICHQESYFLTEDNFFKVVQKDKNKQNSSKHSPCNFLLIKSTTKSLPVLEILRWLSLRITRPSYWSPAELVSKSRLWW